MPDADATPGLTSACKRGLQKERFVVAMLPIALTSKVISQLAMRNSTLNSLKPFSKLS